ncbi:MAG: hypothetical protein H6607_10745 [Flavobacteriales bacterium]|nr:hypothetical protein [Flavobacteriales bacterium]
MGLLETAVVVYLRELCFPEGFDFPLKPIGRNLAAVELWREVATIVMLIGVGYLAGHNKNTRFGWFLYAFALWDIFYYVFLKLFLGWPASVATWDVLFLIPVIWVGPVWAPVLLSLIMIGFTVVLNQMNRQYNVAIGRLNWLLLIVGSVVCIVSFCVDYVQFSAAVIPDFVWTDLFDISKNMGLKYVPHSFPYWIFLSGLAFIISGIGRYYWQNRRDTMLRITQLF